MEQENPELFVKAVFEAHNRIERLRTKEVLCKNMNSNYEIDLCKALIKGLMQSERFRKE